MKKRSLLTILVVAIGLFISSSLISQDTTSTTNGQTQTGTGNGGGISASDVTGVFVPD